jgi:hypothetical protein
MRLIGYFRHLFYSLRLEEFQDKRVFHILSVTGKEQIVSIPYSYDATVRLNIPDKFGFRIDVHKTLILSYMNTVYKETGILFPLNFFDDQVTKRILKLHYEGKLNA